MTRKLSVSIVSLTLIAGVVCGGCTPPAGSTPTPSTPSGTHEQAATPPPPAPEAGGSSGVFANPAASAGRTVTIDGAFQGYRVDDCRFAADARSTGLTRVDWLVKNGGNCLYVTGGTAGGYAPTDPAVMNRAMTFRARVIDDGAGKYLLQLEQ